MPSSRHVRMTRIAISPRFAIKILCSTLVLRPAYEAPYPTRVDAGCRRQPGVAGRRAAPSESAVRDSPPSSGLPRSIRPTATSPTRQSAGAPDGRVAAADVQTRGPWSPRSHVDCRAGLVTARVGAAATAAPARTSGPGSRVPPGSRRWRPSRAAATCRPELKWPNDVVLDADRAGKLAGILAEADGGRSGGRHGTQRGMGFRA